MDSDEPTTVSDRPLDPPHPSTQITSDWLPIRFAGEDTSRHPAQGVLPEGRMGIVAMRLGSRRTTRPAV